MSHKKSCTPSWCIRCVIKTPYICCCSVPLCQILEPIVAPSLPSPTTQCRHSLCSPGSEVKPKRPPVSQCILGNPKTLWTFMSKIHTKRHTHTHTSDLTTVFFLLLIVFQGTICSGIYLRVYSHHSHCSECPSWTSPSAPAGPSQSPRGSGCSGTAGSSKWAPLGGST